MSTLRCVLPVLLCWALSGSHVMGATIGEVKATALSGTEVIVTGAVTYVEPAECYIESTDRSGGIWVQGSTTGIGIGSLVTATGTYSFVSGEPAIVGASVQSASGSFEIRPFAMGNKCIGGNLPDPGVWDYCQSQWVKAGGANNTGLLVRSWGNVSAVYYSPVNSAKWFYINDGFGAVSDFADIGVLVYSDADVKQRQFVAVTGVSSVEPALDDPGKLVRVIRPRSAGDVQMLKDVPKLEYPFSDEFDLPKLDSRWMLSTGNGTVLTSSDPGWLALTPLSGSYETGTTPQLMQFVPGDFNIELKVRMGAVLSSTAICELNFTMKPLLESGVWVGAPGTGLAMLYRSGYQSHPPNAVELSLQGAPCSYSLFGDNYWFRFRRTGSTLYCSYSSNGVTYSPEYQSQLSRSLPVLSIYAICVDGLAYTTPFTAYVDYIRFTPVSQ